jgi:hypothetical protein
MCTLPGRTYHAVRNTGKNFAVAINYEMEDAPEEPLSYKWCIKGRTKCGPEVLTWANFMRLQESGSLDQDITPASNNEDTILP